ncbi:hypothetical protein Rhal01_01094 [Rubritalea halochordaticola]|uniref:Putative regulatory protein FmdB zinc ribbon domain-containing protein n=1 Tax=Rubritalea halochordaticola TaxID=714537 RepID=A0ABP9UWV2_9BACT
MRILSRMPLYEYISKAPGEAGKSCRVCSKGFELRRPVDREALEVCPLCKNPVKKVISRINTPKITKPLSVTDAKKAGFSVLERREDGNFERL